MVTEARETSTLIGSDKVEGTAVYGANDEKIGAIERVMIEKTSGRVSYAVLSFGGFLGMGSDHYPLPWDSLKYDTAARRVSDRHYRRAARKRAEVFKRFRLELVGPDANQGGRRLLRTVGTRVGSRQSTEFRMPAMH